MPPVRVKLLLIVAVSCLTSCSLPLVTETSGTPINWHESNLRPVAVSCQTSDGISLRGLYLPADSPRGLILHLLPRGVSIEAGVDGFGGFRETMETLSCQGFASLAFDYRGVGRSGGTLTSDALSLDAEAMWLAAREYSQAQGLPVVLRAASLGTLAVAAILSTAATPRAVILAAPVDSATIKHHALDAELGAFLAWMATPFYRSPDIKSLSATIGNMELPGLLFFASNDPYLPADEHMELKAGALEGLVIVDTELDHEALVLRFYGFELSAFAGRVSPELMAAEAKFLLALDR